MQRSPSSALRLLRAFSLVEVAISLGIVAFALTALLGLVPVGLSTMRDSIQTTLQTDILRQLTSELQETPFTSLSDSSAMVYYSEQGTRVAEGRDAYLAVTYEVLPDTQLLADSAQGSATANLKTVRISFFTNEDRVRVPSVPSITRVLFISPGIH